jgi:acyl-CoA synthetase (NDP forming)
VKQALPGSEGLNPIDIGATVNPEQARTPEALSAILDDPAVGVLALLQDCQASLNPKGLESYMSGLAVYGALGRAAEKPVVIISPTGENIHPAVTDALSGCRVPVIRGLHAGLVALRNLGMGNIGDAGKWADSHWPDQPARRPVATKLRQELATHSGTLTPEFSFRILRSYDIPVTKAITVASEREAIVRAGEIGFPMVVKVASKQISHRSDVGGVVLGVQDVSSLKNALSSIIRNVAAAVPHASIDGFELQEEIASGVEAVAGFAACVPFGSLMLVGSGGTMVELMADRAVGLAPLSVEKASSMITKTRLGKLLNGYRNLIPKTDLSQLAILMANLSELAADLGDLITACDLNPVLVRKGSGEIRVVDALMITRDH